MTKEKLNTLLAELCEIGIGTCNRYRNSVPRKAIINMVNKMIEAVRVACSEVIDE